MIGLVLLGLLLAVGIMSLLGWTVDSRDTAQTLWPLEGTCEDDAGPPSASPYVRPTALV